MDDSPTLLPVITGFSINQRRMPIVKTIGAGVRNDGTGYIEPEFALNG